MKVLHVIASVAEIRGGPSCAALDMVRALRQAGVDATIVTTNDAGPALLDVPLAQRTLYQGVPVYFFPRFSPPIHALREFAFSAALAGWLWKHLSHYDLIQIHALFSMPSTLAMVLARLKGIPYVVAPHGLLCQWSLQQSTTKKFTYLRLIERLNLNRSAGLHLNSPLEQREMKPLQLQAPSFVLSHGLQVPPPLPDAPLRLRAMLQVPADEPIILFLSRLHYKKGLEILIASLARIQQERFTFVIAGSGDPEYEAEIRALLQSTGLGDRTRLVGFVEGETKDLILQGATVFALTSYSENFGFAVLEALASGLPVVVTPGVALAELVHQHQFGSVPELDETAISTAILNCLKNPETAKATGDRARQFILEHYTWDKIASQLIEVYQSILENRHNSGFTSNPLEPASRFERTLS